MKVYTINTFWQYHTNYVVISQFKELFIYMDGSNLVRGGPWANVFESVYYSSI